MAHHEQDPQGQWWYCWSRTSTGQPYRTRVTHLECEGCGEMYLPTTSKRPKFCSRQCSMRHTGKSFDKVGENHPKWTGGRKVMSTGYIRIWLSPAEREYHSCKRDILEHRLVMSQHLRRPLLASESVHHKNGDRQDNRLENLELRAQASHGPGSSSPHCRTCTCFDHG